ncbi:MAG: hypothetical protein ACTHNL_16260 [Devosia sp.]|jgi:hypothetical protein
MRQTKSDAVEVFRQFAWHLAGQLAAPKSPPPKRQAKPRGKR